MNGSDPSRSVVHELIRQREQLRAWLARLDEVGTQAPGRVAERVRGDYQDRLQRVNDELGTHRGELEEGLAGVRAALAEAEERRERAQDALEETQLRHLIGELDEPGWDDARPALEGEVADADEALGRARDEMERLSRLVAEVAGEPLDAPAEAPAAAVDEPADDIAEPAPVAAAEEGTTGSADDGEDEWEPEVPLAAGPGDLHDPEPTRGPDAAPAAPPAGDPFGDEYPATPPAAAAPVDEDAGDLPWLDALDEKTTAWGPPAGGDSDGLEFLDGIDDAPAAAGRAEEGLADDDLAFLEELDRAISGGPTAPPAAPAASGGGAAAAPPPLAGTPAGRLICKECGAPNEPHSWYCEVCGSEL